MTLEREAQLRELRALRAEIALLQGRLDGPRPAAPPDPDPGPDPAPDRPCSGGSQQQQQQQQQREAQLGRLQAGLAFLSELTGVRITDYRLARVLRPGSAEGTQEAETRVLRKGRLVGDCRDVNFQLEFQLLESQSEENSSAVITDLSIVMDTMESNELNRFVSWTEEKRDLFLFFRSLHFFLEWCDCRKCTFKYFKEKYPEVVQLPGGPSADSMTLRSPRVPGFEFVIVWMVRISEEGKVVPELDLLPRIPKQALLLDENKAVEQAPHCFRTLLLLGGIEAAIESLVRLLCSEK